MSENPIEHLDNLFDLALVLLGVLSATETPFLIQIFGETVALKFVTTPFVIMILVWLIKELYKTHLPLEHLMLYSEFCWEIWSLSLGYYLLFFYLYLVPALPWLAIICSIGTGIIMYALTAGAYFLEYRKSATKYYKNPKWLLLRFVILAIGILAITLTFYATPKIN